MPSELTCSLGFRRRTGYATSASYSQVENSYQGRLILWGNLQFGHSGLALRPGPEPKPWYPDYGLAGAIVGLPSPPSAPGQTLFYVTAAYDFNLRISPWRASFTP